jgi:hypothetical protein
LKYDVRREQFRTSGARNQTSEEIGAYFVQPTTRQTKAIITTKYFVVVVVVVVDATPHRCRNTNTSPTCPPAANECGTIHDPGPLITLVDTGDDVDESPAPVPGTSSAPSILFAVQVNGREECARGRKGGLGGRSDRDAEGERIRRRRNTDYPPPRRDTLPREGTPARPWDYPAGINPSRTSWGGRITGGVERRGPE